MAIIEFPEKGMSREKLFSELHSLKSGDSDWKHGRMFSLIFNPGDDTSAVAEEAYALFMVENGLSPFAFPSLLKMETEVASMMANLFHGDQDTVGNMTSGGSESILLAVKAARDYTRARKPHIIQARAAHAPFGPSGL